jgi:hypothetical protein
MTYKRLWLEQDSGLQYNQNTQTLEANRLKAGLGVPIGDISNDPVFVDSTATLKTDFAIGTNIDRIDSKINVSNEPTGITPEQKALTTISVDSTARTLTIAPTGASFEYWDQGVKYTKTSPQTASFPDTEGSHFFYFEGENFASTPTFDESIILTKTYVAVIYWNPTAQDVIYLGDERHTPQMPGRTHLSLHLGIGSVYVEGLALVGLVTDSLGNLDSHAQFGIQTGSFLDEDLQHVIPDDSAPATTSVFYKEGGTGTWRRDANQQFPVKGFVAGRLAYNLFSGGV